MLVHVRNTMTVLQRQTGPVHVHVVLRPVFLKHYIYEQTALSAEIMLQNILRKSFEFRARWHLNNSCYRSDCCWDTSSYQRSWERITRYIIFMWSDLDVDLRRRATQQQMTTSTISTTTPPPIIAPRISEIKRHSTLRQRRGVQQLRVSAFLNTYTMGACH